MVSTRMPGEVSRLGSKHVAFCLEAHSILIDGGDGRATSGECESETVLGALALHGAQEHAPSREPRSCHLRREAIRGSSNQTQSDAIRPNQTHSDPIRPNQTQSDPIRPNQTQSHLRALFTPHYT